MGPGGSIGAKFRFYPRYRKRTSDCSDEVTLSRKGAKSGTHSRKLRSTGTKSRTRAVLSRESQVALVKILKARARDLEETLDTRTRELGEARAHLAEALEEQTATSEVLRVISSSPGELEPVFQAMLANATRLCEASYGLMYLCERDLLRMAALHGDLPGAFKEQWLCGKLFRPHPDVAPARAVRTRKVSMLPTCAKIGPISAGIPCQLPESRLPASAHCSSSRC